MTASSVKATPEARFMQELRKASARGELPPLTAEDGKDREVVRSWLAGLEKQQAGVMESQKAGGRRVAQARSDKEVCIGTSGRARSVIIRPGLC